MGPDRDTWLVETVGEGLGGRSLHPATGHLPRPVRVSDRVPSGRDLTRRADSTPTGCTVETQNRLLPV